MKRIGRDPKDPVGRKGLPRDARIEMTSPVRLKRADSPLLPRKGSLAHRCEVTGPRLPFYDAKRTVVVRSVHHRKR
jgi:hypothetical protein